MNSRFLHDNTLIIQLKQHEYIGNFIQKYLTWKSFLYSFELEFYSVLLVFTQNYSKLVFFGNSILDSLYTRLMKAIRVRVSTSVKKEVLVSEYSSEWVLSDHTITHYVIISFVKFLYSEKATKFCEISTLLLSTVHTVKCKVEISQNFVAFSEYMNFNNMKNCHNLFLPAYKNTLL